MRNGFLLQGGFVLCLLGGVFAGIADSKAACVDSRGGKIEKSADLAGTKWIALSEPGRKEVNFTFNNNQLRLMWPITIPSGANLNDGGRRRIGELGNIEASSDGNFIRFKRPMVIISDQGDVKVAYEFAYALQTGSDCQSLYGEAAHSQDPSLKESARFDRAS